MAARQMGVIGGAARRTEPAVPMALAPGVPVTVPGSPTIATRRGVGKVAPGPARPSLTLREAQAVPVAGVVAGGPILVAPSSAQHTGEGIKTGRPPSAPTVGPPINVVGAIREARTETGVPVAPVLPVRRAATRAPA